MTKTPLFLEIAVPSPLRRMFQYLPPADTDPASLKAGIRARVPFGQRNVVGILVGVSATAEIELSRIKRARQILDENPVLPPGILKLCTWAADYYHYPIGEVFSAALPALLRQGTDAVGSENLLSITSAGLGTNVEDLKRAPAQRALLEVLKVEQTGLSRTELTDRGFTASTIRTLVSKLLAAWDKVTRATPAASRRQTITRGETPVTLTEEQASAVKRIQHAGTGTHLLFGITGSGKTEVYLRLIEEVLRAGKQCLVLVPEIGLTPQTVRRFTERFIVPLSVIHSGLGDRDRLAAWRSAMNGTSGIVIGTRSAVFTPLANPGIIIVDEEHDGSFKQQEGFRYSARDLAVMRGQLEHMPVVLGSATPALETWHNANTGKYQRVSLTHRPGTAVAARYHVINVRNQPLVEGFAQPLLQSIGDHLDRGEQVLIFLNRRGFAPVLLCHACGWIAQCPRCDARLTFHRDQSALICHHCDTRQRVTNQCQACGSRELVPLGAGTQRIEKILDGLFAGRRIIRIDRDSTRPKYAMDKFMTEINAGGPAILVGTQLLAKGHHFPDVTLVAIVDMDAGFYSTNYKAIERMGQLILQVGGRAGREHKPGVVAIQTHLPDQPLFRQLIEKGYAAFADDLLKEREAHELPPFYFHALLRVEASTKQQPLEFLESVHEATKPPPSVQMSGPVLPTMERKAGRYRAQMLLSSPDRRSLKLAITSCIEAAEQSSLARKVRWSVDVDPLDLF